MGYQTELQGNNADLQNILNVINELPEASSGGGVEYEIITIPAGATSATYTLPRVTAAYGSSTEFIEPSSEQHPIINIHNNLYRFILSCGSWGFATESEVVKYIDGNITFNWYSDESFITPFTLLLINDPNAEEIYS